MTPLNQFKYDVASVFLFAGLGIFALAILMFFRPLPWLRMGNRRVAVIGLCLAFASCVTGGAFLPPTPESKARPASRTSPEAVGPNKAKGAAFAAEVKSFNQSVMELVDRCDSASRDVAKAGLRAKSGKSTTVYAYEMDQWASATCKQTRRTLEDVDIPKDPATSSDKIFKDVIESCNLALISKTDMLDQLKTILDGDDRPSAGADLDEKMSTARDEDDACVAMAASAAVAAGVQPDKDVGHH